MTDKIANRPPHNAPLGRVDGEEVLSQIVYSAFFDDISVKMNSMIDEINTLTTEVASLTTEVADLNTRVTALEQP